MGGKRRNELTTTELVAAVQKAKKRSKKSNRTHNKFIVMGAAQRLTDKQIRYAMFLSKYFNVPLSEVMLNLDKYAKKYREDKRRKH